MSQTNENQKAITSEIEKKFAKKECKNIGKIWTRKCPTCDNLIEYKYRYNYLKAERNVCRCKKCYTKETNLGRYPTEQARTNMSVAQTGKKHTEDTLQKMRGENNGMYGVFRCGKENPFYGEKHDEETRRKMRVAACKRIVQKNKSTGRIANVNPKETSYFSELLVQKYFNT